ncbi:bifunctional 2-polyprenyl-6-hydroxyphenol methylase/3-demethylubiquinol 3-O-methyltransferase UbiG [Actinomyces sp.]|uniref:class I SAM-dependent methyltransferase n=1 Tax=Actinomyces sp. TaxID=29317 RepID=UPI0026DD767D|nr:class I SAM-dependent methyltransferase [Actinomyces sp.]MDO4901138.1 class I SAM-dependent methyltransferase [Actinomyces sp.]
MTAAASPPPICYWNHNAAFHDELVADAARRGGRALDVGCGEGLLMERLAAVCDEVVGIELDQEAVGRARRRLVGTDGACVRQADVMKPNEVDGLGEFDTVTCVAVLHHLPLAEGLERMAALVAPGGRLLIIGLAADTSVVDWLLSALSVVPIRVASLLHHEQRDIGVPTAPARESLREIRAAAAQILPGSRVRRRFYWRYSLVWDRPLGSGH